MVSNFLIEETTVRESGQSSVFKPDTIPGQPLMLTLGITHAVEHESVGVDIFGSQDGINWTVRPLISFTPKSYCGTYKFLLPKCDFRFLKAVWRPQRWSSADQRPFFRLYLYTEPVREGVLAASAA